VAPTAASRISLRPHDPHTGAEIEREEVVKGYEYDRGRYVTFTADELKALDVESTGIIDMTTFALRAEVDPLYFATPYYVYPDGPVAIEPFQVLSAAMEEADMVGLGRITLSRRERMAVIEARASGMMLITLRSNEEVRSANFAPIAGEIDPEMVAIAATIIRRRIGSFDPATFGDGYQEALRALIDTKLKGLPVTTQPARAPTPVIDLMAALKKSLAQEETPPALRSSRRAERRAEPQPKRRAAVASKDRRQRNLLLPVQGGDDRSDAAQTDSTQASRTRRRKA
jgi:DNA end-binding protein Ku